jgi:hypothetical protein
VKEEECVGSSVKRISHFAFFGLLVDGIINNRDDGFGEVVQIKDWWECVEADRVELVAILNKGIITRMISYVNWLNNVNYYCLFPRFLASSIFERRASIFDILSRVTPFLSLIKSLVSVESFIPKVEETYFSLFSVSRMITLR